MAKKDAYYFSHDCNAQDDPKCMQLIDQLQMEGYGIFWALIEKLRSEKDYKLPLTVITSFARRWQTTPEKIKTVISKFGLFVIEDGFFYSHRLKYSMEYKSEMARLSVSYRKDRTTVQQPNNDPNTPDVRNVTIKGKESKVKKRKEKGGVGELGLPSGKQIQGRFVDAKTMELVFEDGSKRMMDENEVFAYKKKEFNPKHITKPR